MLFSNNVVLIVRLLHKTTHDNDNGQHSCIAIKTVLSAFCKVTVALWVLFHNTVKFWIMSRQKAIKVFYITLSIALNWGWQIWVFGLPTQFSLQWFMLSKYNTFLNKWPYLWPYLWPHQALRNFKLKGASHLANSVYKVSGCRGYSTCHCFWIYGWLVVLLYRGLNYHPLFQEHGDLSFTSQSSGVPQYSISSFSSFLPWKLEMLYWLRSAHLSQQLSLSCSCFHGSRFCHWPWAMMLSLSSSYRIFVSSANLWFFLLWVGLQTRLPNLNPLKRFNVCLKCMV